MTDDQDLARQLDEPPTAAEPAAASPKPGEGLDPPAPPAPPKGGKPERPKGEIWKGCPVKPLGVNGSTYYFLDVLNQMQGIGKLEAQQILKLFGNRIPALCWHFAQHDKDGNPKPGRFDQTRAAMVMYAAAAEKGLFQPDGAVRGVGAWLDDDGQLIYHCGDRLIVGDEERVPDGHQDRIYPAYPAIARPAERSSRSDAVDQTLTAFESWAWSRPEVDPMICLGMVGCLMMGGALAWRPTFWNTGSRAAGKSTFQALLKHLLGRGGLIQSSNTTMAGITARVGHSSLPVAIDEFEPGEGDGGREKAIIDLARIASSGGEWMRGSSDQKGASGNVYSTFFFSSILIPGRMSAADLSRLVVLSLEALPEGATPPPMRAETWRERGAQLRRTLIDRWPSWQRRLDLWRDAMQGCRLGNRDVDNYATILAMAQMLLSADVPSSEYLAGWVAKIVRHIRSSVEEVGSDADDVLTHLLSQTFDPFRRGERHTVATWLRAAGHRPRAGRRLFGSSSADDPMGAPADDASLLAEYAKRANTSLAAIGLRVIGTPTEPVLFVATARLQGLKDLFDRTPWAAGAWTQSLKRVKGARPNCGPRYLEGQQTKGTEIPFASMPGLLALDGDEVAPAPRTPIYPAEDEFA